MTEAALRVRRAIYAAVMGALVVSVASCRENERPIGMTLLFQSAGMRVGVMRFDPDGMRGPAPGAIGGMYPRGGASMSFMPGDSKRRMPKFVDVEWTVTSPELEKWWKENISNRADKYSEKWRKDYQEARNRVPRYSRRIDLTGIITPALVAQVRRNNQNTQLRLTVIFDDEEIDIRAEAYKWR